MNPVRIGYVRYLNTAPLVAGLEKLAALEMTAAVPSRIIGMLLEDQIDVGLVSLVDAARSDRELALLPVGMIGCDGPTMTVRVFSREPLERVDVVHADTDSHTSAALCRVVLERMHGRRVEVVDFDARERFAPGAQGDLPRAMLLIGDKVVADPPARDLYPHQLDLGQAWKELTGLPFMYAVWMVEASRIDDERVGRAAQLLDRQRRHNLTRLDWIVQTEAPKHRWPLETARRYVGELLRYEVTDRAREAAGVFLGECARLGIAPEREVRWADLAAV